MADTPYLNEVSSTATLWCVKFACVVICILCLASPAVLCQEATNAPATPTVPDLPDVNAHLLHLVIQDQWDRGNDMFSGRQVRVPANLNVTERDAERQAEVRKMLSEGKISTGRGYYFAALIFQHSSKSEDLMLAHVLAVTAVTKENGVAKWMAAATMDRYLWSIKQPQVFGTQFQKDADQKWTMQPYDRNAVSDSVRTSWCVVSLAEQGKILKDFQNGGSLGSTQKPNCR